MWPMTLLLRSMLVVFAATAVFAADVTGKWQCDVVTNYGPTVSILTVTQNGSQLEGSYAGTLGVTKVTGTVSGDTFEATARLAKNSMHFKGTLEKSGERMKGTIEVAGEPTATFVAVRQ
jgi:hypothetical protein